MMSPSLSEVWGEVGRLYKEGVHYRSLGTQVLWVRDASGHLRKRFISGTNTLSQHVGGNAIDIAPLEQTTFHIRTIDEMVGLCDDLRARGYPVGRILWRGVRNHYPHHAHIEGAPPYTQAKLWSFYERGTDDMTVAELVEELQGALVAAGYDLGTYGPNGDGVDGDLGNKTRNALIDAFRGTPLADHSHKIVGTLKTGGLL